jgi:3-phenylpropionate/cinnamic acid dioxygenase small subunit
MALNADDRTAVTELLSLHGHLFDAGELDRLDELFTDDVVYDVSDFGQEPLAGIAAIREASLALGAANPIAHHITNVVLTEITPGQVRALSKGLGVHADGTCGSVTYDDTVVRGRDGWRISRRRVIARRVPLGGA